MQGVRRIGDRVIKYENMTYNYADVSTSWMVVDALSFTMWYLSMLYFVIFTHSEVLKSSGV